VARTRSTQIVRENLDECVLCELCLDASLPGVVWVIRQYDDGAALER
jgi:NAD-dependent dihydropyrimidine dehydrogenase PreA subunit